MTHGIEVTERSTALSAVIDVESAVVAIGAAPVNMVDDPLVNEPFLAMRSTEAQAALGYCLNWKKYGLCELMYVTSSLYDINNVIYINVLDPKKHRKELTEVTLPVKLLQAHLAQEGVFKDTLVVKAGETELVANTDYVAEFDTDGTILISLVDTGAGASATEITVSGIQLDPDALDWQDIVGTFDVQTGKETGSEVIRQIYSKFGIMPNLIIAPGWSQVPEVGVALATKAGQLNGVNRATAVLDLDTTKTKRYTDCKDVKEGSGFISEFAQCLWPQVKVGSQQLHYSSVMAPLTAYTDAQNDGVPVRSPSNIMFGITGLCLDDGTEVTLTMDQASAVNEMGVTTATRMNGWRTWGNYTCAYPGTNDPKDMWYCVRRMFNYEINHFILTYFPKVDSPLSRVLLESIIDSENYFIKALAAQNKWAGGNVEYIASENPATSILGGELRLNLDIAPFPPAQHIIGSLGYAVDTLTSSLAGGE